MAPLVPILLCLALTMLALLVAAILGDRRESAELRQIRARFRGSPFPPIARWRGEERGFSLA